MQNVAGRAVVEALMDALKRLDFEGALALMADDVVYQNVPLPPDRGKAQVARTLRAFSRVTRAFDVKMHHIAESGGTVLTERTDIIRGPLIDLEFWVCGTFEVRDGKIVLWRDYFDVMGFGLQLLTGPVRSLLRRSSTGRTTSSRR